MVRILVSLSLLTIAAAAQAQPRIVVPDGRGGYRETSYMSLEEQSRLWTPTPQPGRKLGKNDDKRLTREWTSADGKYKTTAAFVKCEEGKVTLLKTVVVNKMVKREAIVVPLTRLCEADRKWVEEEQHRRDAAKRKAAAVAKRR